MIEMRQDFSVETDITDPNILPFEMVWIDSGNFKLGEHLTHEDWLGSTDEDDRFLPTSPLLSMQINQGFWMGKYLITKKHWENLSDFPINFNETNSWFNKDNAPKRGVDWLSAIKFCRLLNMQYQNELPNGYMFSLPTEAQWEYACKAGENQDYITSFDWNNIPEPEDLPLNNWGLCAMLFYAQWCYDIAALYNSEANLEHWIGNVDKENWFDYDYSEYRMLRSMKNSVYREYAHYTNQACFRVCLRPIISEPNCDLNDPTLIEEGINMLVD